ncbi:hypothetical protein EJ08DRAFT_683389 [Tothia fuscella]|uniref:Uncharacterized protein n=1 Tax=Tothia fuscella TaxID=1048955 RepID=A0A9P4NG78_9PEZI|nr:hypothetical protein EJ08DRAFT_683389 [Tothia fuscella]
MYARSSIWLASIVKLCAHMLWRLDPLQYQMLLEECIAELGKNLGLGTQHEIPSAPNYHESKRTVTVHEMTSQRLPVQILGSDSKTSPTAPENVDFELAPKEDLVVKLYQTPICCTQSVKTCDHEEWVAKRSVTAVRVQRSILADAPAAGMGTRNVFAAMLRGGFREAEKDVIELRDSSTKAMLLLFRICMHTTHFTLYFLVQACDKYNINGEVVDPVELVFLAWKFDRAANFTRITKQIVYETHDTIVADNPTEYEQLSLPTRIKHQMRAARARVRKIFHIELFRGAEALFNATCQCAATTYLDYHRALYSCVIKPFAERQTPVSMHADLESLSKFRMPAKEQCEECESCTSTDVMK